MAKKPKTCPGHDANTDCEIDPDNPCDACNEAEDKAEQERQPKEQMKLQGKRAVIFIPATSWVKGKGHRPAFQLEGETQMTMQGDTPEGGQTEPWYWGHPTDCAKSLRLAEKTAEEYNADNGYTKEEADEIVMQAVAGAMRQRRR